MKRLGDKHQHDDPEHLCVQPHGDIAKCMSMITPQAVVDAIKLYSIGGTVKAESSTVLRRARRLISVFSKYPDWNKLTQTEVAFRHQLKNKIKRLQTSITETLPTDQPKRRGIVIPAGGKYLVGAWVNTRMLRQLECELPIEVWHLENEAPDAAVKRAFESLGAVFVDYRDRALAQELRKIHGWALKSVALMHCEFDEVILLDADNLPIENPERLFYAREYLENGAVFWPDRGYFDPRNAIWKLCNLSCLKEREFESGQILVDKNRCARALELTMWLNAHSDIVYKYIYGDKDTFHIAWRLLGMPYSQIPHEVVELPYTMCQHDFDGIRMFQHRGGDKWAVSGNRKIEGFALEDDCIAYVQEFANWTAA